MYLVAPVRVSTVLISTYLALAPWAMWLLFMVNGVVTARH